MQYLFEVFVALKLFLIKNIWFAFFYQLDINRNNIVLSDNQ